MLVGISQLRFAFDFVHVLMCLCATRVLFGIQLHHQVDILLALLEPVESIA